MKNRQSPLVELIATLNEKCVGLNIQSDGTANYIRSAIGETLKEYGIVSDAEKSLFYRSSKFMNVPSKYSKMENKRAFYAIGDYTDTTTIEDFFLIVNKQMLKLELSNKIEELEIAKSDVTRLTNEIAELQYKLTI